ncbi:MAG: PfkB family carbohydrate kinase [Clostridiales bacterium]|jgi:sugar/nucleoside kinase (ribokinase family)|nr:PfkB family carbohydrate kinase [Clostridiales bacterium]
MKILCLGMIMCDQPIYPVPENIMQIPSSRIRKLNVTTGGDAKNVAMTLRILGAPDVSLSGLAGDDLFGRHLIESAKKPALKPISL